MVHGSSAADARYGCQGGHGARPVHPRLLRGKQSLAPWCIPECNAYVLAALADIGMMRRIRDGRYDRCHDTQVACVSIVADSPLESPTCHVVVRVLHYAVWCAFDVVGQERKLLCRRLLTTRRMCGQQQIARQYAWNVVVACAHSRIDASGERSVSCSRADAGRPFRKREVLPHVPHGLRSRSLSARTSPCRPN